ncbi:hypothetical protein T492DRAFT_45447 [Pavlovales sp. CCMP2436]|nr:hypothetical protein T492DRAFT_45447 [Pavlovales sp. CCMP2436]
MTGVPHMIINYYNELWQAYGVALPQNFRDFLANFRFISFDRFYVYGFSCVGASYHTSLIVLALIPAFVTVISALYDLLRYRSFDVRRVLTPVLLATYLVTPTAVGTIYSYWSYDSLDVEAVVPVRVLRTDMSIDYDGRVHSRLMWFAALAAAVYSLGVPLALLFTLRDPKWNVRFLALGYRRELVWWEAVDCVRMILLIGVVVIVGLIIQETTTEAVQGTAAAQSTSNSTISSAETTETTFSGEASSSAAAYATVVQLLFAIGVQACYTLFVSHVRPLESHSTHLVSLLSHTALLFVLIASLVTHLTVEVQEANGENCCPT